MSEWISVEDKSPDFLTNVFVSYYPFGDSKNELAYAACTVNEYGEFFSTEAEEFIEFATHWMSIKSPIK